MSVLETGSIFSPKENKHCNYEIVDDPEYAQKIDDTWQTHSLERVFELKKASTTLEDLKSALTSENISDFHWCWNDIVNSQNSEDYIQVTFYLTVNGIPEGALHTYFPKETRLHKGKNLVYIDRIATAPWNRPHQTIKHFSGVGSILILFICRYSRDKGCEGCIGLHSLPQAEPFYDHLGMKNLGIDLAYEGLKYFELEKHQALSLIAEEL
ncbi:GNAT family N-acetyltransferase [Pseudoalteromonas sp. KAN5]|uniref:GNAT family N-acetyltransferase n=1 Tax=Pseudoalteromonas sp. KAN5 TaxID=2916633 RepID=UPI001FCA90AE|nr:GNAT family N-acetyltransferase [Pseudoalteromonas sp. KAN5]BDF95062.1 hypothetical protein KAN5_19000 [Pseudoalteromonas sp. KAN5]